MAELIYVYIKKNYSKIKNQELNFSNKFKVSYEKGDLCIENCESTIPSDFFGSKVTNISLLVGKNGTGKSSILDLISYGSKNRNEFQPTAEFFCIYHVRDNIFYFEGTKGFNFIHFHSYNYNAKEYNCFFSIEKNGIINEINEIRDKMSIDYLKNQPKVNWIDEKKSSNENNVFITRKLNKKTSPKNVYKFLLDNINFLIGSDLSTSTNIKSIFSQRNSYSRKSYEVLYILYECLDDLFENSDEVFYRNNFTDTYKNIVNQRHKLNVFYKNEPDFYKRSLQDKFFGKFKKQYFILRMLEKQVINGLLNIDDDLLKDVLREIHLSTKDRMKRELEISIKNIRVDDLLELKKTYMLHIVYVMLEQEIMVDNDLINFIDFLENLEESFFKTANTIVFPMNEKRELISLIQEKKSSFLSLKFSDLSDGEKVFLNIFSQIASAVKKARNLLFVLDEPDVNLHPEWSRRFILNLVNIIEKYAVGNIQIILSTHSPFLLTDIPKENVFLIEDNGKNKLITKPKVSFAGNLYDIISDSFFLEYPIGEFARTKISNLDKDNYLQTSILIDDPILKNIVENNYTNEGGK